MSQTHGRVYASLARLTLTALALCAALLRVSAVRAEASDAAKADELFRAGKQQLGSGNLPRACAAFAESLRLDPATGTLLALAVCHEREGKLGTAAREYTEVVTRSQKEGRADREAAARQKLAELEPKVSHLSIKLAFDPTSVAGFELRVNGTPVQPVEADQGLQVDDGPQIIEASAPLRTRFSTSVMVAPTATSPTTTVVTVPVLSEKQENVASTGKLRGPERAATAAPTRDIEADGSSRNASGGFSAAQWVGVVTLGCGLTSFGVMGYLAVRAANRDKASSSQCQGDLCTAVGRQARLDAVDAGNAATVAAVVGGVLTVAGVALYIVGATGGHERAQATAKPSATFVAAPFATPHALGAVAQGRF